MIFDWTINLSTIITLLGVLGGGFAYMAATLGRFDAIIDRQDKSDERLKNVETEMHRQTDMLVSMARYEERLMALDARVTRLSGETRDLRKRTGEST